jgi:hypothetical protein
MTSATADQHVTDSALAGRTHAEQDLGSMAVIPAPADANGEEFERWNRRLGLALGVWLTEHSESHRFHLYAQGLTQEQFDAADAAFQEAYIAQTTAWPIQQLLAVAQRAADAAARQGITAAPGTLQVIRWQ